MAPVTYRLVRQLEAEWDAVSTSPLARSALARWADVEPALIGYHDLAQLRAACHGDAETGDRILAALVRLGAVDGHNDALAARVVVQLLLPGAVRLQRTMVTLYGYDAEAAEAAVIGEVAMLARTYPWRRRPRRVAANVLLDCRQRLLRGAARAGSSARERPYGLVPAPSQEQPSGLDDGALLVLDLLRWARRSGVLTEREAALLFASRVAEIPIRRLEGQFGRRRSSLFTDRAAAERRLRSALADKELR